MGLTPSLLRDGSGRYPCLILSAVSRASMASINGFRFDWRVVSFCNSEVVGGFERVWDSPWRQLNSCLKMYSLGKRLMGEVEAILTCCPLYYSSVGITVTAS